MINKLNIVIFFLSLLGILRQQTDGRTPCFRLFLFTPILTIGFSCGLEPSLPRLQRVSVTQSFNPVNMNPSLVDTKFIEHLRYIEAVGVITLLYDHLLTLNQEVQYVWKARWTAPKFLFLLIRYVVPCAVIFTTYQLGANLHKDIPPALWFGVTSLMCLITTGPALFLIMLWSWAKCERNRRVMLGMLVLFVIAQMFSIALCIFNVVQISRTIETIHLGYCILTTRGALPYFFVPGLICEGVGLLIVLWNNVEHPSKEGASLADAHHEDGAVYIIILFSLQLANLLITRFMPPHLISFCMPFTWSMTNVTVTRLILKLRKHSFDKRESLQSVACETRPRVHFADQ